MDTNRDKLLQAEILELLSQHEDALKIGILLKSLKENPGRRTVQRALRKLLDNRSIYKLGNGPATRYQSINKRNDTPSTKPLIHRSYPALIKLSPNSTSVMDYVTQPLSYRKPVGYQREFLDNYTPNKTWYLDAQTRALLHQIGKMDDTLKPAGTYGPQILHSLLIDLSWASSRLEGNTYSRLDTHNLIDFQQYAEGKDAIETQMILNHKQAILFLVDNMDTINFNAYTFLNLHGLLSESLLHNPLDSGNLRTRRVDIGGSVYKPTAISQLIGECFAEILDKAYQINDPFEQLFFIIVHIPYLQAFVDVNKRVSRLAANIPLLKHKLCPLTFIGLPEQAYIDANIGIYELQDYSLLRDVLVWAYERSAQEYVVAQKSMVAPHPVRLKHGSHIHRLIKQIVIDRNINPVTQIARYAKEHIPEVDQQSFEAMVLDDLQHLHEGVLARYGLRVDQFSLWKAQDPRA